MFFICLLFASLIIEPPGPGYFKQDPFAENKVENNHYIH